jgi:hypothetical protein
MKKVKRLLISFIFAAAVLGNSVAYSDAIDDCIKCPGLEAIFALKYKWVLVA